ncbi:MAG: PSD1 domain-containing protein [Pirellulaceae bacterium]|nr:PSD1 domain-containing protein [Pirellulaceae bacterium]
MFFWPVSILGAVFWSSLSGARAEEPEIQFSRDIRPILSAACFKCHGFDQATRQAELRLDTAQTAATVLDAEQPLESEFWKRVTSSDPEAVMPPADQQRQLTDEEKSLLQRWLAAGAKYQGHWSLEPIAKPAPPATDQRWPAWQSNPVDRFVLTTQLGSGTHPLEEASRETLIRRVALTLTGLPPTLQELDTYLSDSSSDAYQRMVDRYLDSPHYGEEMARHWLDVARYGDTHGLHLDNVRQIWAYRDWVVQAFNSNLPFDQFTIQQLAGDLLPEPSQGQMIASGFNRCNVTTGEGGAIDDEFRFRYAVDRATTTFQAWMGITGGCAVCHDHKYDPISMRDFYSLYAFFYSMSDPPMDGNIEFTPPYLSLATAEQKAELERLRLAIEAADSELQRHAADAASQWESWQAARAQAPVRPVYDVWLDDNLPLGSSGSNTSRNAEHWVSAEELAPPLGNRSLVMSYGDLHDQKINGGLVPRVIPQNPLLEFWIRVDDLHPPRAVMIELVTQRGSRRYAMGDVSALGKGTFNDDNNVRLSDLPASGRWTRIEVGAEQLNIEPGTTIQSITLAQFGGIVWWDAVGIRGSGPAEDDPRHQLSAWLNFVKGKDVPVVPGPVAEALKRPPKKADPPSGDGKLVESDGDSQGIEFQIRTQFIKHIARDVPSHVARARATWQRLNEARRSLESAIPGTIISGELAEPLQAHIMLRGQYNQPGDPVQPGTPGCMPPMGETAQARRLTRLDLAQWLMRDDHPLTARVTVNRFWQQVFGTGLVSTSDDFGMQGAAPSHPQLLDWLAADFRDSHWDVKRLMRTLVLSATFRQSSSADAVRWQQDPDNRWLARGPRVRLEAEQIRDLSLAASGLINLKLGGPGFLTYQPPNIWEPVGYANSNTRYYLRDRGNDIYRRSLYAFVKRTAPPPFMANFDAPSREMFCTRRQRSNTPLQALQLMNDVQHVEAARQLATRVLQYAAPQTADRIDMMFRLALARFPDEREQAELAQLLAEFEQRFAEHPPQAAELIHFGQAAPPEHLPATQLASYTLLANLIFNLDETVTRN